MTCSVIGASGNSSSRSSFPGALSAKVAGGSRLAVRRSSALAGLFLEHRWLKLSWLFLAFTALPALADDGVILAWDPSTGTNISGYNIYYGVDSQAYSVRVSAGNTTSTTISGLTPGTTYFFSATAYNSLGIESPFSNEISY